MIRMENPLIDAYLADGCGRCKYGGTPDCKVHRWEKELVLLRKIILSCGLMEELKWSVPCYTFKNKNVLILAAFKEYCAVSFFKGSLIQDEVGLLQKQSEHSQAVRLLKITALNDILQHEDTIRDYVHQAIELESAGIKVPTEKPDLIFPEELKHRFDILPALKKAFLALTYSKQRAYVLHFSSPKNTATRKTRIDKAMNDIMQGKGLNEK